VDIGIPSGRDGIMPTDQGYLLGGSQKVNLGYVLACGIDRLDYGSARERCTEGVITKNSSPYGT
jgi:hypothetical protein